MKTYCLEESEHARLASREGVRRRFFLAEEGVAVAFIDLVETASRLELWAIEVREGHRGEGHVRRGIGACEEHLSKPLVHEGGYTPEGFARVAHLFLDAEGKRREQEESGLYPSTFFVVSWEARQAKYPLQRKVVK